MQAQLSLQTSVVLGKSQTEKGCGGTFIARTVVLTASHCVDFYDRFKVYDYSGGEYGIASIVRGKERDLALLVLDRPTSMLIAPLGSEIGVGERVWMVGAPPGIDSFSLSSGIVSIVRMYKFSPLKEGDVTGTILQEYLQLDIRVFYGSSGGGVFNDQGQLVGVNVRALVMRMGTEYKGEFILWAFAVAPGAIKSFLQEAGVR
ncbi:MAG: S1 family peptidase [Nitrososphaera sp.]